MSQSSMNHPNIVIAGFPKCGTSYLWTMLSTHPQIRMAHPNKEYCGDNFTQPRIPGYFTINACINTDAAIARYVRFGRPGNTKFLLSVRNPADYAWAGFNYWTHTYDKYEFAPARWVHSGYNYRTPELFHEYVVSGGLLKGGDTFPHIIREFTGKIRRVEAERIPFKIVSQETIASSLTSVAMFIGVRDYFPMKNTRINSGYKVANRGAGASDTDTHASGVYEISGYRGMLASTRQYIQEKELSDCRAFLETWCVDLGCGASSK